MNKSEAKPDIKPGVKTEVENEKKPDVKPKIGVSGDKSSHKYGIPANTFTKKCEMATGKNINIKLCDPNGFVWNFTVWNKDPIYNSVVDPYIKKAGLDSRVSTNQPEIQLDLKIFFFLFTSQELRFLLNGERMYSIYADGTWCTPIDLDVEDGGE